jgi:hypothetical protein
MAKLFDNSPLSIYMDAGRDALSEIDDYLLNKGSQLNQLYNNPELSLFEKIYRGGAKGMEVPFDVMGFGMDHLVPDQLGIGSTIGELGMLAAQSSLGKGLINLAQAYPRTAGMLGATATYADLFTGGRVSAAKNATKGVGKAVEEAASEGVKWVPEVLRDTETFTRSFRNYVPDFYKGGWPKIKGIAQVVARAPYEYSLAQLPKGKALQEKGISPTYANVMKSQLKKLREGPDNKDHESAVLEAQRMYETYIIAQSGGNIDALPDYLSIPFKATHKGIAGFDMEGGRELLFEGSGVPLEAQKHIMDLVSKSWGMSIGEGLMAVRHPNPSRASGDLHKQAYGIGGKKTAIPTRFQKLKDLAKSKGKGGRLTEAEFTKAMKNANLTVRKVGDGQFVMDGNFRSADYTLGGIGVQGYVDLNTGQMVQLFSDEHDLFSATVPNGERLMTVGVPRISNLYSGKVKENTKRPRLKTEAAKLAKKYGIDLEKDGKGLGNFSPMQKAGILIQEKMMKEATPTTANRIESAKSLTKGTLGAAGLTGAALYEGEEDPLRDTTED